MLFHLHEKIQNLSNMISTVTGLDIEIVDPELRRVAGTGIYAGNIGQNITNAGNLLKTTLRLKQPIFIENPRENEICENCCNKTNCKELLSLCAPICDNETVYGAMELVCFSENAKNRLLLNSEMFMSFLSFLTTSIAMSCQERKELADISELLDALFQVLDTTGKGTILYNDNGEVVYHNNKCDSILKDCNFSQIEKNLITQTGVSLGDFEEFNVKYNGESHLVIGKHVELSGMASRFDSVFMFDTLQSIMSPSLSNFSRHSQNTFDQIIGESEAIKKLKHQIALTKGTNSSVLITGESGTGKELVARAIHSVGERANEPFIAINCGAIPDSLLESELFGYVGGAFTGASQKGQVGKFEMAQGGVLFLDEISSMPLYLQVKILRALQEKTITRLGSSQTVKVDIRIIAATNENLPELMLQQKFRKDLYYRLNVIPIEIKPLRERLEDLNLLISFFIEKYCTLFAKTPLRLSNKLLNQMHQYSWPGNVRELENSIEYLVNMSDYNGFIDENSLYTGFLVSEVTTDNNLAIYEQAKANIVIPLAQIEKEAIKKALRVFGDSTKGKKLAAQALGISLASMYRKLKE